MGAGAGAGVGAGAGLGAGGLRKWALGPMMPVRLTALEFRLLAYLAHRPGRVVSKTELTEHLYAQDFDRDSNTLEVVVGRLRRKLDPALIETLRGQGYRLVAG